MTVSSRPGTASHGSTARDRRRKRPGLAKRCSERPGFGALRGGAAAEEASTKSILSYPGTNLKATSFARGLVPAPDVETHCARSIGWASGNRALRRRTRRALTGRLDPDASHLVQRQPSGESFSPVASRLTRVVSRVGQSATSSHGLLTIDASINYSVCHLPIPALRSGLEDLATVRVVKMEQRRLALPRVAPWVLTGFSRSRADVVATTPAQPFFGTNRTYKVYAIPVSLNLL